jgi:hypothetical protein
MAKQTRTTLKGYFETGDIPTGGNYVDLIDSPLMLNTENTGSANILGTITASGDISSSGDIIGVTGSFDYVKTDKLQVGAAGGTDILSIDGGDLQLENGKQITFSDIGDGNTGRVRIVGNEDSDTIQMFVDNNNSHTLRLDTTGVSIGTSTPAEKLTVEGNISASGFISAFGSSSFVGLPTTEPSTTGTLWLSGSGGGSASGSKYLMVFTG